MVLVVENADHSCHPIWIRVAINNRRNTPCEFFSMRPDPLVVRDCVDYGPYLHGFLSSVIRFRTHPTLTGSATPSLAFANIAFIPRNAWRVRSSFSISEKRTWPSP